VVASADHFMQNVLGQRGEKGRFARYLGLVNLGVRAKRADNTAVQTPVRRAQRKRVSATAV